MKAAIAIMTSAKQLIPDSRRRVLTRFLIPKHAYILFSMHEASFFLEEPNLPSYNTKILVM